MYTRLGMAAHLDTCTPLCVKVRELFNPDFGMFHYHEAVRLHWFRCVMHGAPPHCMAQSMQQVDRSWIVRLHGFMRVRDAAQCTTAQYSTGGRNHRTLFWQASLPALSWVGAWHSMAQRSTPQHNIV